MSDFPDQILYNSARHAVQVIGCGGQVVAHYPMSSSDYNALVSETGNIDGYLKNATVKASEWAGRG